MRSKNWQPRTSRTIAIARKAFVEALSLGLSITNAATKAGIPRRTAYDWRDADKEFRAAWDDALESGTDRLEDEAYRRAHDGCEKPIVSMGKVAKDEQGNPLLLREYSDTLMALLLKSRRPDKFRERQSVEHSGPDGAPIETREVTDEIRAKALLAFLAKTGAKLP